MGGEEDLLGVRSPDAYEPPEGIDGGGFSAYANGGAQSVWGGGGTTAYGSATPYGGAATPYGATPYGQGTPYGQSGFGF